MYFISNDVAPLHKPAGTLFLLLLLNYISFGQSSNDFVTRWKTDNPGVSNPNQITIPFQTNISINMRVNWGDGTVSNNVTSTTITHTYASPGTYTVRMAPTGSGGAGLSSIRFAGEGDRLKLLSIEQWGTNVWERFESSFSGCENLVMNATDAPRFGIGMQCGAMFKDCKSLNQNINHWDVLNVVNMSQMFQGCTSFNQPLNNWNVIRTNSFDRMFEGCTSFNQSLANWNPVSLLVAFRMFAGATSFNSPVWSQGSSALMYAYGMFQNATAFNQPVNFSTQSCQDMSNMFKGATSFNQSVANFSITNLTDAIGMLDNCAMNRTNYDATLVAWAGKTKRNNVPFSGIGRQYCTAGATARAALINTHGWRITGDELAAPNFLLVSAAGSNNQVVCVGVSIQLIIYEGKNLEGNQPTVTGLPQGVGLSALGSEISLMGAPTATGTFNYTITGTGTCGSGSTTGTITVNQRAEIIGNPPNNIRNQIICQGAPIVPVQWTTSGVKAVRFVNLPQGVTGSFQNNTITISGTPTEAGSFTMRAFYSDDCKEFAENSSLTIRQPAAITLISDSSTAEQSRCGGQSIEPVRFFSNTGQAQVSGLPLGLTATVVLGNVTISGAVALPGVYTYTVTALSSCGNSAPISASLTVEQAPTVIIGDALQAICSGNTTGPLSGTAAGEGLISAIWSDGGAGGTFSNNSGATPALVTYTPAPGFSGTVSLRLTASNANCTAVNSKALQVLEVRTATWLGLTDNWAAPTNWSTGAVPGPCTAVIVPVVGVAPILQGTSNRVLSLTVQSGASVSLAPGATLLVEK